MEMCIASDGTTWLKDSYGNSYNDDAMAYAVNMCNQRAEDDMCLSFLEKVNAGANRARKRRERRKQEANRAANLKIDALIKNVKFNGRATIVNWVDGTTTKVVRAEGDVEDREKALLACIAKKYVSDNKGRYNRLLEKWCGEE